MRTEKISVFNIIVAGGRPIETYKTWIVATPVLGDFYFLI